MKKLQLLPTGPETIQETKVLWSQENIINSDYYSIYSDNTDIIFLDKKNSCELCKELKLPNPIIYHQSPNLNDFYKMIKSQTYRDNENLTKNNLIEYNVKAIDSTLTISLETKDKLSSK